MKMKLKMSLMYLILFVVIVIWVGIEASVIGDPFNARVVFILMGIFGVSFLGVVTMIEKKLDFTNLDKPPAVPAPGQFTQSPMPPVIQPEQLPPIPPPIPEEPKKDLKIEVAELVVRGVQQNANLKTIVESVKKLGYSDDLIESVINEMIEKKIIAVNKPEPKPLVVDSGETEEEIKEPEKKEEPKKNKGGRHKKKV